LPLSETTARWQAALGASPGAPTAVALLGLAAVVRAGFVLNAALNPDESQHLHSAWLVARGQVPFVDFWEHHVPLLYYLLAPLTRWLAESPAVYLAGRLVMVAAGGAALLLLYRAARGLGQPVAAVAVVVLALQPRFVEHTTEIRPDVPALVAWLAAVLALRSWRERDRPASLWRAGLALGLAGSLTLKAVYAGLGAAVAVAAASARAADGPPRPARILGALGRLGAGATAAVLALLAALTLAGGTAAPVGLARDVLGTSLRFIDPTKELPVSEEGIGFFVLAAVGVVLTLRREGLGVVRHPVHGPLLVPAAVIGLLLVLPGVPAVYRHAWLPVLAAAAVYAGMALATLFAGARAGRPGAAVVLLGAVVVGLVAPAAGSVTIALRDRNSVELRLMRLLLSHACPGEPVLDGTALAVFRPAAHRYRVLINGVRLWVANGVIAEETIVEDIRRSRPPLAYPDWRVRAMVGPLQTFLARHYVQRSDGLLVPGARIAVAGGPAGGRAHVDLLLSGAYRLASSPGIAVAIDQTPAGPGLVSLREGRHEVRWTGPPGAIGLTLASCAERGPLPVPAGAR
jgi:4-amino-4-deoxy-L-arabinose transferase-like glycosyltransferase